MDKDHELMSLALDLASRGRLSVSPNPMVGCIIVKNGQIVGQGHHQYVGGPHAEILALQAAGSLAQNATAYVTLEPCCHFGRTPPCTDALIKAGINKVIIACEDPNPLVSGKGISALREAHIQVAIGVLAKEAMQLNRIFFYYMKHHRPFVIAKWAMSFDGKTSTHPNDTRDISTLASRTHSHHTRHEVDAILIGANTAICDNPQLTIRHLSDKIVKQPIRIVLSSKGKLPLNLTLLNDVTTKTIIATTTEMTSDIYQQLLQKNVDVIQLTPDENKQVNLHELMDELGKRQITSLLVEGGMQVLHSFFKENLVNSIHLYLAPLVIAELSKKKTLSNVQLTTIDKDYFLSADYEDNYV